MVGRKHRPLNHNIITTAAARSHALRDHRIVLLPAPADGRKGSKYPNPHNLVFQQKAALLGSLSSPMASSTTTTTDDDVATDHHGSRMEELIHHLRQYRAPRDPDVEEEINDHVAVFRPRRAAVLVCLFENEDGVLRVVLTKRSSRLFTHSGEVSLPGGKREEGDVDDSTTALREAREEIGLDPSLVTVVAALEPFLSKHLLKVVPVIAILADKQAFTPVPNIEEVDDVFTAPLEMFLKDENRRCDEREWMGAKFFVQYFDYETEDKRKFVVWGLTASILVRAASVVFGRPPAFMELNPVFKVPRNLDGQRSLP